MSPSPLRRLILTLLAAGTLALAACGGGEGSAGSGRAGADATGEPGAETGEAAARIGELTLAFEGVSAIGEAELARLAAQSAVREQLEAAAALAQEDRAAESAQDLRDGGSDDGAETQSRRARPGSATLGARGGRGDAAVDDRQGAGLLETPLPHSTQAPVSRLERKLLKAYLDRPQDAALAAFLGLYQLNQSLLAPRARQDGASFKATLMARYFLGRARELGRRDAWITWLSAQADARIARVVNRRGPITVNEDHAAHAYFNETFNYREGQRYTALAKLLDDYVKDPRNMYTVFLVDAANLWIGGEADHSDPTVLQNFVVGGFFSVEAMKLAQQLEVSWLKDNSATPRFRMASILGGFSALQRRWLAKLHGDEQAVALIDAEHRQWREIHRSFHAFTVGLALFEEPQNFAEGLFAWGDALAHCNEEPVRTCSNLPRLSHNFEGFLIGYVDFLLKAGQVEPARQLLLARHVPEQFPPIVAWADWDLGKDSWLYREQNAEAMAAAWANDDPADDPTHFFLKKKQWGQSTSTCQACHQAQSSKWTEAQKQEIVLPPESVATVGTWPAVSTSWYGSLPRR